MNGPVVDLEGPSRADRMDLCVQYAVAARDLPKESALRRWAAAALAGRRETAELTIRIVGSDESSELNHRFRGKRGPTNVLSFPFEQSPDLGLPLLGDIVLCAPLVLAEARQQGKSAEAHWAHLTVHGTLHLLGYDHQTVEQAAVMEGLEVAILGRLGYADPYQPM